MQEPTRTQPGWDQPPLRPAKRPGGARRGLAVTVLAILGAFLGMLMPSFLFTVATGRPSPLGVVAMFVGLWLGLAGGIWFGVRVTGRTSHS